MRTHTPLRRSARALLAVARAKHGTPTAAPPIIRSLQPSQTVWEEAVLLRGDFPHGTASRVALRLRDRIELLRVTEATPDQIRVTLPSAPLTAPDRLMGELFVVAAGVSSAPCGIALSRAPISRRVPRATRVAREVAGRPSTTLPASE